MDKDLLELMESRHSVRQYLDEPIPGDMRQRLSEEVARLNDQGGLSMQLFFDEPRCFDSMMAHYGKFTGVANYLAIVGPKGPGLDEKAGYWGEEVVLLAQSLGLNSCWVGMTHGRCPAQVRPGERLAVIVALGYGKTQGVPHKSKPMDQLCLCPAPMPAWFEHGMRGAMLAPTAVNQQKFLISYDGARLEARLNGRGFFAKTDLGIARHDFERASGHAFDDWEG